MACRRPGTPEPPRAPIATKRQVSATASSMKRPELVRENHGPRPESTRRDAGQIGGSDRSPVPTLSPRPTVLVVRLVARLKAAPPAARAPNEASRSAREAERRTSLSGEFARDKGELRFIRPFWRSQPDHVPDPRRHADQEKYNQKRRIGVERAVENPANPQADNHRRDELAASPQAKRHRGAGRARFWVRLLLRSGGRAARPFSSPDSRLSRARSGRTYRRGLRGPNSWGQALPGAKHAALLSLLGRGAQIALSNIEMRCAVSGA